MYLRDCEKVQFIIIILSVAYRSMVNCTADILDGGDELVQEKRRLKSI